jgi:NADH-quinone oxidoreductase subunit N
MDSPIPVHAVPDLMPALPEITLAIGALALVLLGAWRGERSASLINALSAALLAVALVLVVRHGFSDIRTFNDAFVVDGFGTFMKALTLIGSIVALILTISFAREEKFARFEYPILVVLSTLGMLMMISANDLIALYVGLELQSLALYVVASIHRDNVKSAEAGLKYFVLGALSSGMLLYGASFIYGHAGSLSFDAIRTVLTDGTDITVVFGLVFVIAGLCFKISAVPFHMWTPDVYEGAPTPVTAFFASAPKVAAVALFTRLLMEAFPGVSDQWRQIIAFVAIASMALGAFAAIGQTNLKRLMAYSSIGNLGYVLVAIAAGTVEGAQGVAIFMAMYVVTTLAIFAAIIALKHQGGRAETIADLSGLARSNPSIALVLLICMFSLIGIPAFAGFIGKYFAFAAAIKAGLVWLAVIGMLASVVSAFYYLRIVKVMYLDEPKIAYSGGAIEVKVVMAIAGVLTLLLGLYPSPVTGPAFEAAKSLF